MIFFAQLDDFVVLFNKLKSEQNYYNISGNFESRPYFDRLHKKFKHDVIDK